MKTAVGFLKRMEMEPFQVGEKSEKAYLTRGGIVAVQSRVQVTRAKIVEENSLLWRV